MGSEYLSNPLVFLIQIFFGLYTAAVVLRFLFQLLKADFYNPISQFIVKITTPVLHPLRKVIPGFMGVDTASLVLAWALKTVELLLIILLTSGQLTLLMPLLLAIPSLLELFINIFLYAVFIQVILSWVAPGGHNPAVQLIYSLTEPVMRPARRLIAPIQGIDLSPMLVIVGLYLLKMLLIPPVEALVGTLLR